MPCFDGSKCPTNSIKPARPFEVVVGFKGLFFFFFGHFWTTLPGRTKRMETLRKRDRLRKKFWGMLRGCPQLLSHQSWKLKWTVFVYSKRKWKKKKRATTPTVVFVVSLLKTKPMSKWQKRKYLTTSPANKGSINIAKDAWIFDFSTGGAPFSIPRV